ncbi:MAG TPA: isoprenylcysteine carboxylmethyltransferase family protein [Terracidiphilus sp.]|nr:isoprenylcysteine carboxylmethyltransferase family protein [Terracidiphilus sp.]
MKLNIVTLAALVLALIVFGSRAAHLAWTPWHTAGVAIAVPAFLLFVLARMQLGSAFSLEAKASKLVTTGLYSRIRNPIYVFGALMIAGAIVFAAQPWLFLVYAVLIPLQIVRSRKEAKVLEEKFGAEYVEYRRKTWF